MALAGLSVSMMMTLIIPLLPDLPGLLDVSAEEASWLITITLLVSVVATPSIGRLADMFGKRRLMLFSLSAMVAGSLLAAVGASYPTLLVARTLQGLAISLTPVAMSAMRDEIPRERLGVSVAIMSGTQGFGAALGLPLSGIVYHFFGWNAVFWLSAVVGILLLVGVLLVIPESPVRTGGRFDIVGAVLLGGGLASLLIAITRGGHWGWLSATTLGTFALSVALFAVWIPWEWRVGQPLVDLRTMMRRSVLLTNAAGLASGFGLYTNLLATAELLEMPEITGYGFGMSAMVAGIALLPAAAAIVIFSPVSSVITGRFGAHRTLLIGFLALVIGYLLRVFLIDSVTHVIITAFIIGFGVAFTFAAQPVIIMRSVPVTETASANSLNVVLRSMGTSTASAAIAAELTGSVMLIAGKNYPTLAAFQIAFALAAVAAVLGAVCSAAIRTGVEEARAPQLDREVLARGQVLDESGRPLEHVTVTVLDDQGEQLDFERTDERGNFVIALPSWDSYRLRVEALGQVDEDEALFLEGKVTRVIVMRQPSA